jgi:hypothetical protein
MHAPARRAARVHARGGTHHGENPRIFLGIRGVYSLAMDI